MLYEYEIPIYCYWTDIFVLILCVVSCTNQEEHKNKIKERNSTGFIYCRNMGSYFHILILISCILLS